MKLTWRQDVSTLGRVKQKGTDHDNIICNDMCYITANKSANFPRNIRNLSILCFRLYA